MGQVRNIVGSHTAKPHRDCEEKVRAWESRGIDEGPPCHYMGAVRCGVEFAVENIKEGKTNVDSLRNRIIKYLHGDEKYKGRSCGFKHSAASGGHIQSLQQIVNEVSIKY